MKKSKWVKYVNSECRRSETKLYSTNRLSFASEPAGENEKQDVSTSEEAVCHLQSPEELQQWQVHCTTFPAPFQTALNRSWTKTHPNKKVIAAKIKCWSSIIQLFCTVCNLIRTADRGKRLQVVQAHEVCVWGLCEWKEMFMCRSLRSALGFSS